MDSMIISLKSAYAKTRKRYIEFFVGFDAQVRFSSVRDFMVNVHKVRTVSTFNEVR